jgi:hypothetical protein
VRWRAQALNELIPLDPEKVSFSLSLRFRSKRSPAYGPFGISERRLFARNSAG